MSGSSIFLQERPNLIHGRSAALRELAKQLRLDQQGGHAAVAERHAAAMPPEAELVLDDMIADARESFKRWGPYRSTHEAYGVIREELDEMFDAIRANDDDAARAEALQVAACAFRFALDGWRR